MKNENNNTKKAVASVSVEFDKLTPEQIDTLKALVKVFSDDNMKTLDSTPTNVKRVITEVIDNITREFLKNSLK